MSDGQAVARLPQQARKGTAMRGGDGEHEGRSPYLPDDYYLDETSERDFVVLCAGDGREVAWFSAVGADPKEIERAAWEDFGEAEG